MSYLLNKKIQSVILCGQILLTCAAAGQTAAPSQPSPVKPKEPLMPPTFPSGSFPPPAIATPIEYHGIRFQQADLQSAPEREPGAVYLAAIDPANNATLWLLKIESVSPGAPLFAFDFPVHLTRITPGPGADEITVQTNSGNHWRINIAERKVIGSDRAALAQPAAKPDNTALPLMPAQGGKVLRESLLYRGVIYRQGSTNDGIPAQSDESWLLALDEKSQKELWRTKVGTKPAAPLIGLPWNNAQLTFSDISIGPGADQLTIVDYAGQHYLVDLKARTTIKVDRQGANPNADMFEPPLDPLPPGF